MKLRFGRALILSRDPDAVRRQLGGERVPGLERAPLADNVSTDEMTPAWTCYFYDEQLGHYCLVGLRGGSIEPGSVRGGGFEVLVGGQSFGCGSSRETAPFAQRAAGIRLVVAGSFEPIYRRNCHNLGLYTSTDLGLVARIERGEGVPLEELVRDLDPVSRSVVLAGGLGAYGRDRLAGRAEPSAAAETERPMTLVEKIIAAHAAPAARRAVAPGDALFVRADVRFSHDYVTAMVDAQFRGAFGDAARVREPESVFLFRDHLVLLDRVMPDEHRRLGLWDRASELNAAQRAFAARHGVTLFDEGPDGTSEGICHQVVIERLALPGQIVVGTDSHTCMAGVVGALAFGVGSTDMAAGLYTGDFRITVPETVRLELGGRLGAGVCAKDAWLALLARDAVKQGVFRGRVIELGGAGYFSLPLDERATLTNMAAEAGAFTAVAEADSVVADFIAQERGGEAADVLARSVRADAGAMYAARLELDLGAVEPMVALPGDPRNGVPLRELARGDRGVRIDIAYGGSCTAGKRADMDLYARVLAAALARGQRVADGVKLYLQVGSRGVRRYALERGYLEIFREAGAILLDPACGACIRSGPGVSSRADEVTVSATSRNFPGRSGPGQVYLASPLVVAASAIAGKIAAPEELEASSSEPVSRKP